MGCGPDLFPDDRAGCEQLTTLHDPLLPKLVFDEIHVSDADILEEPGP